MPDPQPVGGGIRRRGLTRERVLEAAIALADAEGIAALTMRRLADEVDVKAMALYNHVDNKDDLLDAMIERAAESIVLPDDDADWRTHARQRAISAHVELLRHPWLAPLWASRIALGPARMSYMDSALRSLRRAGFTGELLDRSYHAVENHIIGHALQSVGFPLDSADMRQIGQAFLRAFPVEDYPDLADHIRHHLAKAEEGRESDEFEFGLDLILDGLERLRHDS